MATLLLETPMSAVDRGVLTEASVLSDWFASFQRGHAEICSCNIRWGCAN